MWTGALWYLVTSSANHFPLLSGVNIDVEHNFRNCSPVSDESWATVGWEIAGIIIRDGAMSTKEYYHFFQDDEKAQQLLIGNVFTLQPGRNTVSFDCRIAEIYARKQCRRREHQDWRVRWRRMFLGCRSGG